MDHIYRRKPRLVDDVEQKVVPSFLSVCPPHTFIMRWDTDISCHSLQDFEMSLKNYVPGEYYYDWSVWEYDKIAPGDKVYMVRTGSGRHGVVLVGTVMSWPYADDDWRGSGCIRYYVRICVERLFHPDRDFPFLSCEELANAIPDFDWEHGHSGMMLSDDQADRLESLAADCLGPVFIADNFCDYEFNSAN